MGSRYIASNVEKKLYAESMGRCMNPACMKELFFENGDLIEKAHIDPYCKSADNTFDNLVVLCPNCHTNFDKNNAFAPEEVLSWKRKRREELARLFSKKFSCFDELKAAVAPLLEENKSLFEACYLHDNISLWNKFEVKMMQNNHQLKMILTANLDLIQSSKHKSYSNTEYVRAFLTHVEEFELTRSDSEKARSILFPAEINSMFGVAPIAEDVFPSTESLELLIEKLVEQGKFQKVHIGVEKPCIYFIENGRSTCLQLDDAPRLRQIYYNYNCFRKTKVRLDSLNYALKFIRSRNVYFEFSTHNNLREIYINKRKMIFVYEYCLSQAFLSLLSPEDNSLIVNLHNWNGSSCISRQAYYMAASMNVTLLTMKEFYVYINEIKK